MEEKKTLKEIIEEAGRADNFTCALCDAFDGNPCSISGAPKDDCYINVACLLIDAIDREYIERPKFEDGEPVKLGDKFCSDYVSPSNRPLSVDLIDVAPDGSFCIGTKEEICGVREHAFSYYPGERVRRSELEVIGADGKPIKVGDTVWGVEGGREFTVTKVYTDVLPGSAICCAEVKGDIGHYHRRVDTLTHEQPDSLERIFDDLTMSPWDYCNSHGGTAPGQDESDCIAYMMRDLLARQRKVLERDAR